MTSSATTRADAVLGFVEDVLVTGSVGVSTWLTTHSYADVLTAVSSTQVGKGVVALALSGGRTSRLTRLVRLFNAFARSVNDAVPVSVPPSVAAEPAPAAPAGGMPDIAGQVQAALTQQIARGGQSL